MSTLPSAKKGTPSAASSARCSPGTPKASSGQRLPSPMTTRWQGTPRDGAHRPHELPDDARGARMAGQRGELPVGRHRPGRNRLRQRVDPFRHIACHGRSLLPASAGGSRAAHRLSRGQAAGFSSRRTRRIVPDDGALCRMVRRRAPLFRGSASGRMSPPAPDMPAVSCRQPALLPGGFAPGFPRDAQGCRLRHRSRARKGPPPRRRCRRPGRAGHGPPRPPAAAGTGYPRPGRGRALLRGRGQAGMRGADHRFTPHRDALPDAPPAGVAAGTSARCTARVASCAGRSARKRQVSPSRHPYDTPRYGAMSRQSASRSCAASGSGNA